ncbi:methyltransferase family protein [Nanoarchaeota archaeon]
MKQKIVPPNYFMVLIILNIILHFFFPISTVINQPYTYWGLLLIVIGIYPSFWRFFTFKKHRTTTEAHKIPRILITSGLFRLSRNPTYFGMFLVLLGEAVLLGSLVTFIAPIIFIIATDLFTVPVEEKNLEKRFGKKYKTYKKKVRRWI